jgi:hypothetical protein
LTEQQLAAISAAGGQGLSNSHDVDQPSKNDQNAKVNTAFVGDKKGRDWIYLDRGRLVVWILGELEEKRWTRECPTLANA